MSTWVVRGGVCAKLFNLKPTLFCHAHFHYITVIEFEDNAIRHSCCGTKAKVMKGNLRKTESN